MIKKICSDHSSWHSSSWQGWRLAASVWILRGNGIPWNGKPMWSWKGSLNLSLCWRWNFSFYLHQLQLVLAKLGIWRRARSRIRLWWPWLWPLCREMEQSRSERECYDCYHFAQWNRQPTFTKSRTHSRRYIRLFYLYPSQPIKLKSFIVHGHSKCGFWFSNIINHWSWL